MPRPSLTHGLPRHAAVTSTAGQDSDRGAGLAAHRPCAVLRLLPTFLTTQEIADELHISVNTAKTHMRAVHRKLDASSRRVAVA